MATSTFDKVFVVSKKADRMRLAKILSSNNKPAPIEDLPVNSPDDCKKNEALILQCLSHSER